MQPDFDRKSVDPRVATIVDEIDARRFPGQAKKVAELISHQPFAQQVDFVDFFKLKKLCKPRYTLFFGPLACIRKIRRSLIHFM